MHFYSVCHLRRWQRCLQTQARHFTVSAHCTQQAGAKPSHRVVFSGIQPTGIPHLGNYLGALSNWVKLQQTAKPEDELFFSIVGWHALTLPQNPKELKAARMDMLAVLLAIGLNPERSVIFHQDQNQDHTELAWILNCITPLGKLRRMTTWKSRLAVSRNANDESEVDESLLNAGLFTYPVLQAADILAYKATEVPVGEDQQQHLELSRDIADSFNRTFKSKSPLFPLPQPVITPSRRVLSLKDASAKMSKSAVDPTSRIMLSDTPKQVASKLKAAVTDSIPGISYDPISRPGTSNLLTILSACLDKDVQDITAQYQNYGHGDFKNVVIEAVEELLKGPRAEFERLRGEESHLLKVAEGGAEKARLRSAATMDEVPKNKAQTKAAVRASVVKKEEDEDDILKTQPKPSPSLKSKKVKKEKTKKEEEDIKPKKEEQINILIKQEGVPDQLRPVSLIPGKNLDIFDLSQLGLRPVMELDAKYNQGFSRMVITQAFRGGTQDPMAQWKPPAQRKPGRETYMAFNTSFNPTLVPIPGRHGVIFANVSTWTDGSPVLEEVPLFVFRAKNDWVLTGSFNVSRSGTIPAEYFPNFSKRCQTTWVKYFLKEKEWVGRRNQELAEEADLKGVEPQFIDQSEEGILFALMTGLITLGFTVVECMGYKEDWFERLLQAEKEVAARPPKEKKDTKIKKEEEEIEEKVKGEGDAKDLGGSPPKKKRRATVKQDEGIEEKVKGEEDIKDEIKDGKGIKAKDVKKRKKDNSDEKEGPTKRKLKTEDVAEGTRKSKRIKKVPSKIKEYIAIDSDDDFDFDMVDGVEEAALF